MMSTEAAKLGGVTYLVKVDVMTPSPSRTVLKPYAKCASDCLINSKALQ